MGVDYDSILAIGWFVDAKIIQKILADTAAESCGGGCLCKYCVKTLDIPEGWEIVTASPYFDSEWVDHRVALSAKFDCGDGDYMYHGMSIPGTVVMSVLSSTTLLEAGFSFAVKLGADKAKSTPSVLSLPHIW
jgi:hypothetical protein